MCVIALQSKRRSNRISHIGWLTSIDNLSHSNVCNQRNRTKQFHRTDRCENTRRSANGTADEHSSTNWWRRWTDCHLAIATARIVEWRIDRICCQLYGRTTEYQLYQRQHNDPSIDSCRWFRHNENDYLKSSNVSSILDCCSCVKQFWSRPMECSSLWNNARRRSGGTTTKCRMFSVVVAKRQSFMVWAAVAISRRRYSRL